VIPHDLGNLFQFEMFTNFVPHSAARLASHTARCAALGQKCDGVVEPQQLDQGTGISVRVLPLQAHGVKSEPILICVDPKHSPPRRHNVHRASEVAISDHQRPVVEHFAVKLDLTVKAAKAVTVRFDFVPAKHAVYQCKIDSTLAATNAKFLNEHGVFVTVVFH